MRARSAMMPSTHAQIRLLEPWWTGTVVVVVGATEVVVVGATVVVVVGATVVVVGATVVVVTSEVVVVSAAHATLPGSRTAPPSRATNRVWRIRRAGLCISGILRIGPELARAPPMLPEWVRRG
jgi:hypothetical protein